MITATVSAPISVDRQARKGVTTGVYELYLPGQQHRIFFADTPDQVLSILDAYLLVDAALVESVQNTLATKHQLTNGISRWSSRVVDEHGQVAYLAAGATSRRLPRHAVGDSVRFYLESESYWVTGLSLQFIPEENATRWLYHYAEGERLGWGVSDALTRYGATPGELAREMQQLRDQGQGVYYRVVLAEQALVNVEGYNTYGAGPWHGLDKEALREAVAAILPYAFVIRVYRVQATYQ